MVKHVLIVDDDEDDRDLFCAAVYLTNPSIKCMQALGTESALHLLKSREIEKPDLIFLDLNMPRLNGKVCLKELKRDKYLKDIPVIIYTTSKLKADEEETRRLGAAYFLTKPGSWIDLCEVISEVVSKKWEEVLH